MSIYSFNEFMNQHLNLNISESYVNLFGDEITEYSDELFKMVQKSYANIGGIKGRGFRSPKDMVDNIKMVKISRIDSVIKAVIFYKDKDGRKVVAVATDFTLEGKEELRKILKEEFERSYMEVSGAMLGFIRKNFPEDFETYKIKNDLNLDIFKNITEVDDYYYDRNIGDSVVRKVALGTPYNKFY
jgi:hypothetical protein